MRISRGSWIFLLVLGACTARPSAPLREPISARSTALVTSTTSRTAAIEPPHVEPETPQGSSPPVLHTSQDLCPDEAEIVNGFQDLDGCPDDLPPDLRAVVGVLKDISSYFHASQVVPPWNQFPQFASITLLQYPRLRTTLLVYGPGDTQVHAEELKRQMWYLNRVDARGMGPAYQGKRLGRSRIELTIDVGGDEDLDGFADGLDPCPDIPGDGIHPCPGPDGDGDGMLAPNDRCPTVAEARNGYQDGDGCPDVWPPEFADVSGIIAGLDFERDTDILKPSAEPILDRIAIVLSRHSDLCVEISGHIDSTGVVMYSKDTSRRRADAVKKALVDRGIAEHRLEVRGAGPDEPIDTNKTAAGRRRNRRIEFWILVK